MQLLSYGFVALQKAGVNTDFGICVFVGDYLFAKQKIVHAVYVGIGASENNQSIFAVLLKKALDVGAFVFYDLKVRMSAGRKIVLV